MSCFKCGSHYVIIRKYEMKELAKGSPSRGKKMQWVTVKVKQEICKDCGSAEMTYT